MMVVSAAVGVQKAKESEINENTGVFVQNLTFISRKHISVLLKSQKMETSWGKECKRGKAGRGEGGPNAPSVPKENVIFDF